MIAFAGEDKRRMELEWPQCHPDLRAVMLDFDVFSQKQGLPEPTFTQVVRYRSEQKVIYLRHWRELLAKLKAGGVDALTLSERTEVLELQHLNDFELGKRAENRFTWHLVRCAVDVRTVGPNPAQPHYSQEQMTLVTGFFREHCLRPLWEFLVHDVHGPHMHVGRRDFSWRQKYAETPPPPGAS